MIVRTPISRLGGYWYTDDALFACDLGEWFDLEGVRHATFVATDEPAPGAYRVELLPVATPTLYVRVGGETVPVFQALYTAVYRVADGVAYVWLEL